MDNSNANDEGQDGGQDGEAPAVPWHIEGRPLQPHLDLTSLICFGQPGKEIDIPVNARRRCIVPILSRDPPREGRPYFTLLSREQIRKEGKTCPWCQLAKFSTHDTYPITIINEVDNAALPGNFQFIEESILCEGVERAHEDFRSGCQCEKDEQCERRACSCLQDMYLLNEDPGPRTKVYAYHSRGQHKDCLRLQILESRDPIYECHSKCKCSANCNNRVVERGRKVPLEIFRTSNGRGWGVLEFLSTSQSTNN